MIFTEYAFNLDAAYFTVPYKALFLFNKRKSFSTLLIGAYTAIQVC